MCCRCFCCSFVVAFVSLLLPLLLLSLLFLYMLWLLLLLLLLLLVLFHCYCFCFVNIIVVVEDVVNVILFTTAVHDLIHISCSNPSSFISISFSSFLSLLPHSFFPFLFYCFPYIPLPPTFCSSSIPFLLPNSLYLPLILLSPAPLQVCFLFLYFRFSHNPPLSSLPFAPLLSSSFLNPILSIRCSLYVPVLSSIFLAPFLFSSL